MIRMRSGKAEGKLARLRHRSCGGGFLCRGLRPLPRLRGVFVRLAREFVATHMVAFLMVRRGRFVCVRRQQMKFSGSCVRGLRHFSPPNFAMKVRSASPVTLILTRREVHT